MLSCNTLDYITEYLGYKAAETVLTLPHCNLMWPQSPYLRPSFSISSKRASKISSR